MWYRNRHTQSSVTDQMGIPEIFVYNFLSTYAITIYGIFLESYDTGLLNKPKYTMSYLLVIEI